MHSTFRKRYWAGCSGPFTCPIVNTTTHALGTNFIIPVYRGGVRTPSYVLSLYEMYIYIYIYISRQLERQSQLFFNALALFKVSIILTLLPPLGFLFKLTDHLHARISHPLHSMQIDVVCTRIAYIRVYVVYITSRWTLFERPIKSSTVCYANYEIMKLALGYVGGRHVM